eukprot:snap_masked-scaffold_12-processed-gene-9.33-mRNA-1 protein AED:1.00 eAED:1.00 QI:0/-1/0/0/-1/1/1/0/214
MRSGMNFTNNDSRQSKGVRTHSFEETFDPVVFCQGIFPELDRGDSVDTDWLSGILPAEDNGVNTLQASDRLPAVNLDIKPPSSPGGVVVSVQDSSQSSDEPEQALCWCSLSKKILVGNVFQYFFINPCLRKEAWDYIIPKFREDCMQFGIPEQAGRRRSAIERYFKILKKLNEKEGPFFEQWHQDWKKLKASLYRESVGEPRAKRIKQESGYFA